MIISGIVSVWTNNRVLFGGNNAKYNNVYLHKKIIHKYRTCEANEAGTFLDYVNTYVGKYGFYEKSKPVVYTESISKTQPWIFRCYRRTRMVFPEGCIIIKNYKCSISGIILNSIY